MKVKEVERTANIAWSPAVHHPILLAAGTAAQQLDASFSTSAALEIYNLSLSEPGADMSLVGTTATEHRFHKVIWGHHGMTDDHPSGVIAGGCDGGFIQLYSADRLMKGETNALLSQQDKHSGPVRALDFNPFQTNLFSSGASESEIFIWDLNHLSTPMTPGAKSQPPDDITCVAWNRQVQHILASTFAPRCVVWDLRKNEPIIKVSDSNTRMRCKVVAWHPEVATQLCLASEDDHTPVVQLWDLRFATSPLKILESHQRGILSIAWCQQDPDLLISCGKDSRIICWNPNATQPGGDIVCELPTANQWGFDVEWCPRNPAIIATASFDGHISCYSLMGGQQQAVTNNKIADSFPGMEAFATSGAPQPVHQVSVQLKKPPKWLRRPVGASFGFGGQLVSFENVKPAPNQQSPVVARHVTVSRVVTEPELIARSNQLEASLEAGQFIQFCQNKVENCKNKHDESIWKFLKANFEADPRTEFLGLLGFKPDEINAKLNKFIGKPANAYVSNSNVDSVTNNMAMLGRGSDNDETNDQPDEEDESRVLTPDGMLDSTPNGSMAFDAIAASNTKPVDDEPPYTIVTKDDTDGLICQALLLGNIEAAVNLCLEDGRMADAIVLAMTGGPDLLARTQYKYFENSQGYLSNLICAVVTEDWSQVIRSCSVDSWKEALAAALTYSKPEDFPALCELLGERLENENDNSLLMSAQLCYICAGNLNKLVESWTRLQPILNSPQALQDLVELVMILRRSVEHRGHSVELSGSLAGLLTQYASLLAAQGSLAPALAYLGNSNEESVKNLRDRLQRALGLVGSSQAAPVQQISKGPTSRIPQTTRRASGTYLGTSHPGSTMPSYNTGLPNAAPVQPAYGALGDGPSSNLYNPLNVQTTPFGTVPTPPITPASAGTGHLSPGSYGNPYSQKPWNPASLPYQSQSYVPQHSWNEYCASSGISRTKPHLVDPSVQGGPMPMIGTAPYNPSTFSNPAPYSQPTLYGAGAASVPGSNQPLVPSYPTGSTMPANVYNPAPVPSEISQPAPPPAPSQIFQPIHSNAGWNDPPLLSSQRHRTKSETAQVPNQDPIMHPIFGAAPEQPMPVPAMNGSMYTDPNVYMPPQVMQPTAPTPPAPVIKAPEPPKPKGPVPDEHKILGTVFEDLRSRCADVATNAQTRRKLEDVSRKLEALYDALREGKLSQNTLYVLHQIVQYVQAGDYQSGLVLHTQLVSGTDFSQIVSFMPGVKVLLQTAQQLGVYVQ